MVDHAQEQATEDRVGAGWEKAQTVGAGSECKLVRPEDVLVTEEWQTLFYEAWKKDVVNSQQARRNGLAAVLAAIANRPFTPLPSTPGPILDFVPESGADSAMRYFRARILKPEPEIPEALEELLKGYRGTQLESVVTKTVMSAFRAGEASAKGKDQSL